jgi:hypothetical protein
MRLPALSFVALSLLLVAAGCDGGDSSQPSPPTVRLPIPTATVDAGCTTAYPVRLKVETKVAAELPYLNEVAACATRLGTTTLLRNNGEVVWIPHTTVRATVTYETETNRAISFRTIFRAQPLLLPGTDMGIPVPPAQLEWSLDSGLSAAWQAHDYVADLLLKHGEKQLTDALSGTSKRRQAMSACVLAGYHAYDQAKTIGTGSRTEAMLAGWGLASGTGDCALAWREADEADALKKLSTVTFEGELAAMRRNVNWISKTDGLLSELERVSKALIVVAR